MHVVFAMLIGALLAMITSGVGPFALLIVMVIGLMMLAAL